MAEKDIFTIGHSTHDRNHFLNLLKKYNINCVVDVRSVPYSKYVPQYNKDKLSNFLRENMIYYIHMGDQLGARVKNPSLSNKEGKVVFSRVRRTANFRRGIARLKEGQRKGYQIALMCSEKDPLNCHRTILVSYQLKKEGFTVKHILADGKLKLHSQLEEELVEKIFGKIETINLFEESQEDKLEEAYHRQNMNM